MRLSQHHERLTNGIGKCAVPMWSGGCPAGFCDRPAYGPQEPDQRRYGGWSKSQGKWFNGYCGGVACYDHGGPKALAALDAARGERRDVRRDPPCGVAI